MTIKQLPNLWLNWLFSSWGLCPQPRPLLQKVNAVDYEFQQFLRIPLLFVDVTSQRPFFSRHPLFLLREVQCFWLQQYHTVRYNHKLFTFPKEQSIRKYWIHLCKRKDKFNPKYGRICGRHFSGTQYNNNLLLKLLNLSPSKTSKRILKHHAFPDQNLPTSEGKL